MCFKIGETIKTKDLPDIPIRMRNVRGVIREKVMADCYYVKLWGFSKIQIFSANEMEKE